MKLKASELIWDQETYARQKTSTNTIDAYTASLAVGATFPAIKVERLINYPDHEGEVISVRDGYHRWKAYQKAEVEYIEAEYWTEEVLDYADRSVRIRLKAQSALFNTTHGDRITNGEKKETARWIAENDVDGNWTEQQIADHLAVSQPTVNDWISDIRAKQRASRDSTIYRLSRLGWTQDDIADIVGITQPRVQQIINSIEFDKIYNGLTQDIPEDKVPQLIQEATTEHRLDVPLAWSIRLDGQSDLDRFGKAPSNDDAKNLKWGPFPYDAWYDGIFSQCDKRFGDNWPGRIPAEIVGNILYFYSEQGDLIMDPMAGGGVVPDVCLALNRKCRAFDIVPGDSEQRTNKRAEIEHWHWNPNGMEWPDVKPDLIFFDPPYFDKKDDEYAEGSISSLPRTDYLKFFQDWFALALKNIKENGVLAFMMSDWNEGEEGIFLWDYADLLRATGWKLVRHIQVPLPTQNFDGKNYMAHFREEKKLGRLERYILVARPEGST